MSRFTLIRPLLLSACVLFFAGCRIIQEAEPGGSIVSSSGRGSCGSGEQCFVYPHSGLPYSEIFTAVPDPGYVFAGWKRAPGHLCAESLEPCAIFNIPPTLTALDIDMYLVAQFVEDSAQLLNLPASINWGQTLDVRVTAASDSSLDQLEFAYGPPGMKMDKNGRLTWKAESIMFGESQQINFGIRDREDGGNVDDFSIELRDRGRTGPVVSSGVGVPRDEYSIWVGQYDNDPQLEILLTDSDARIMTVEYRDGQVIQDWLYPYALNDEFEAAQVVGADLDNDGINEIIAVSENSMYLIEGRKPPAKLIYTPEGGRIEGIAVADVDADAALEYVILQDGYPDRLRVIDSSSLELELEVELSLRTVFEGNFPQVGNVDDDPALEVVLRDGYVIDLDSGEIEWDRGEVFGNLLTLADVNGDGIHEIFASETWGNPKLYDAMLQTDLWLILASTSNRCSLAAADLDEDGNDELVVGDCQGNETIMVYEANRSFAEEWFQVQGRTSGLASLTTGDVDGDGDLDLVFSTGVTTSRYDALGLAILEGSAASFFEANDPAELEQFEAAGVAQSVTGEKEAIYVVAREGGQRYTELGTDRSLDVSPVINDNIEDAGFGIVSDYDNDGLDELLLGSQLRYTDSLEVIELSTGITEWSFPWNDNPDRITDMDVADMNGDGFEDVVFQRGGRLYVLDAYNQTELWSTDQVQWGVALAAADITGDGIPEIIESARNESYRLITRYWQRQPNGSYAIAGDAPEDVYCSRIEVADVDDEAGAEILCLTYYDYSYREAEIRVLDPGFTEKWSIQLPYAVRDFSLLETTSRPINILVTSIRPGYRDCEEPCTGQDSVRAISLDTGATVWESPPLLDAATRYSLHPYIDNNGNERLVFSTPNAMYITPAPAGSR